MVVNLGVKENGHSNSLILGWCEDSCRPEKKRAFSEFFFPILVGKAIKVARLDFMTQLVPVLREFTRNSDPILVTFKYCKMKAFSL